MKKGQVAIFVIIAVLIVVAVVAYFVLKSSPDINPPGQNSSGTCGDNHCDLLETAANCAKDCKPENLPYSALVIHEESWAGIDQIVDLANQYHVPLTIEFWPGVVDFILNDSAKIAKVHEWQAQGHEIGMHSQGFIGDGSCTDPNQCLKPGDAEKYEQLAYPQQIKSGVVPWNLSLLPLTYKYDAIGYRDDGRSVYAIKFNLTNDDRSLTNRQIYGVNLMAGYSNNTGASDCVGTATRIGQYESLKSGEVFVAGLHTGDYIGCGVVKALPLNLPVMTDNVTSCPANTQYYINDQPLKQYMKFLYDKDPQGVRRRTFSGLMETYLIPNNLVVDPTAVCTSTSQSIKKCLSLLPSYQSSWTPNSGGKAICFGISDKSQYVFNFEKCLKDGTYCQPATNDNPLSYSFVDMDCQTSCNEKSISQWPGSSYFSSFSAPSSSTPSSDRNSSSANTDRENQSSDRNSNSGSSFSSCGSGLVLCSSTQKCSSGGEKTISGWCCAPGTCVSA